MSKKKTYFLILIILIVSVGVTLFLPSFCKARGVASAENTLTESTITDLNLYRSLQSISRANGTGSALTDLTFKDVTTLDLSYTSPGVPSDSKKIADITTLREFDLRNLKKLVLSNNILTSIEANIFEGMTNLEYLDVSNNRLTSIDLSMLTNLKVLIVNNNYLTSLDVSNMNTTGYEEGDSILNVSHNRFASFSSIEMPIVKSDSRLKIYGYNNNFTDVVNPNGKFTYILGLQGLNKDSVETTEEIKYYNTGDNTLSAKIYEITKNENNETVETLKLTLKDSTVSVTNVDLPVGNYRVDYLKDDVVITKDNNDDNMWFESRPFSIIPTSPRYVFNVNGKEYQEVEKLTREATLILIAEDDAKVYYSFDSKEWVEGREVKLNKGGSYFVQFKSVKNGVESRISGVTVNASLNLKVPDVFLALLIVMVAAGFVVALYFIGRFLKRR